MGLAATGRLAGSGKCQQPVAGFRAAAPAGAPAVVGKVVLLFRGYETIPGGARAGGAGAPTRGGSGSEGGVLILILILVDRWDAA
jgi:hypothetical protein